MKDIVPASYQRRGGVVGKALGNFLFHLAGWRIEGDLPDVPKVLIAVAPHTSNWDFIVGVLALLTLDIKISFLGKHTIFRGWFGRWVRSMGGIPVDRAQPHGVVGETVAAFAATDKLVLAMAPEGTRQLDKGFKTGFLRIAHAAQVPVLLAYFDFERRVVGFGPMFTPSGDVDGDMKIILDFYRPMHGKYRKVWQDLPA
ncbi:MAG: 1-acyl-sn-glycerol-3-phosphate acyltransferase [Betaproteobacteria bacterium]